jgi:tetratricopeptide (TPR) repeat protein
LCDVHKELGHIEAAKNDALNALALPPDSVSPAVRGQALIVLSGTLLDLGNYQDAAVCVKKFWRILQAEGASRGRTEAFYYLALVRLRQGRHGTAARLLTLAMRSAEVSGDLRRLMEVQVRLGQVLLEMNKLDQACPLLEDAVRGVTQVDSPRFRAIALEALGRLFEASGRADEARPLFSEAQELRRGLPVNAPR